MKSKVALGVGISRRIAQSPQMAQRVEVALRDITEDVQKRRVRAWVESNDGPFPSIAESRRQAIAELAILCDALGSMVAISPAMIDRAAELYEQAPIERRARIVRRTHWTFDYDEDDPFGI